MRGRAKPPGEAAAGGDEWEMVDAPGGSDGPPRGRAGGAGAKAAEGPASSWARASPATWGQRVLGLGFILMIGMHWFRPSHADHEAHVGDAYDDGHLSLDEPHQLGRGAGSVAAAAVPAVPPPRKEPAPRAIAHKEEHATQYRERASDVHLAGAVEGGGGDGEGAAGAVDTGAAQVDKGGQVDAEAVEEEEEEDPPTDPPTDPPAAARPQGAGGAKKGGRAKTVRAGNLRGARLIPAAMTHELSMDVAEGEAWGARSGSFAGSYVMNQATSEVGDKIMFPRKKMRNQLSHYSVGKLGKQLHSVLPVDDPLRARTRSGRCAVVGNGGSLLLYKLGEEIDAHDVVLRLNAGPAKGFEEHVGSKTTYRMVNRLHIGFRETESEMVLQHVSTPEALKEFTERRIVGLSIHPHFYMLDMSWHEFAYNHTDKGVLSNGMYGVLLASELCEEVSVYGFLRDWRGKVQYHYYNSQEPNVMQSKRDNKEEERLALFINSRPGTHRWGEPCMGHGMGSCSVPCGSECALGAGCECGAWHPVPTKGFCYGGKHPQGTGVQDFTCMHRCSEGHEEDLCRGGVDSLCLDREMYDAECSAASTA